MGWSGFLFLKTYISKTALYLASAVVLVEFLFLSAKPYAGDPYAWREEARSIILYQQLYIDPDIASKFGEPGQYYVRNIRNGKSYSKYGIFNTIAVIPPLLIEYVITGELPTMIAPSRALILSLYRLVTVFFIVLVFFQISITLSNKKLASIIFVLMSIYSTYMWHYLRGTNSEATQLLLFLSFFYSYLMFERYKSNYFYFASWLFVGCLVLTKSSYLLIAALYCCWHLYNEYFLNKKRQILGFIKHIFSSLLVLAALLATNTIKFGHPLLSGYHAWTNENFHLNNSTFDFLYQILFSEQWSIFSHYPILLLSIFGFFTFYKTHKKTSILISVLFLCYFLFLSRLSIWKGEWSYGPRYLLFILPIISLPTIWTIDYLIQKIKTKNTFAILGSLSLIGILIFFIYI
ncbi:MAG: hypothetical protein M9962_10340, partial [Oligoflexia bacterium]|nr:hypothetical protein [Oligoflexia bacterium]